MENVQKETSDQFHVVDVPDSPVSFQKGNLTGTPRIVQDASADLFNQVQEWNKEHVNGLGVIYKICETKLKHLTVSPINDEYSPALQDLCDILLNVFKKMEAVVSSIKQVYNHLEGVMKLHEMKSIFTPVFTSWRIQEYVQFSKKILSMYEKELKIKLHVIENIGHTKLKENLFLYQTIWVQQPYVENINLQMEAMLKETTLRA